MAPCLIQQLFRMKIGKDLEQGIVDEVLFPLLRPRKHGPRELLLDIKMTQSRNHLGQSSIIQVFFGGIVRNISPFTKEQKHIPHALRICIGKNTSKLRRKQSFRDEWGSVDILNELRELKHRPNRYRILPEKYTYEGLFIDLHCEGVDSRDPPINYSKLVKEQINEFLEHSLSPGKRLSWGGDPGRLFQPILSIHY